MLFTEVHFTSVLVYLNYFELLVGICVRITIDCIDIIVDPKKNLILDKVDLPVHV